MRRYTIFYISVIILGDRIWPAAIEFDVFSIVFCHFVILIGKGKMSIRVTCQCGGPCLLFVAVHFVPEEGCCCESKLLHLQSVSGPCSYLLKFFEWSEHHIYSPYYFKVHKWSLGFLHAQILVGITLGLRESYRSIVFIWKPMQLGGFLGKCGFLKRSQIMFFKLSWLFPSRFVTAFRAAQ